MRKTLVPLISFFVSLTATAQEGTGGYFYFFNGTDIDYFGNGKRVKDVLRLYPENVATPTPAPGSSPNQTTEPFAGSTVIRSQDAKPFNWDNYNDPSKPEFWDDGGDWIPPRIYRETARNPSKENIERYFAVQQTKARVVARFQEALAQYATEKSQSSRNVDWRKVKITYFYQTSCPHCRESFPIIETIKRLGAKVSFVQLDAHRNPPLHKGSVRYTNEMERRYNVTATPTWVVSQGRSEQFATGSLTISEVEALASKVQNSN